MIGRHLKAIGTALVALYASVLRPVFAIVGALVVFSMASHALDGDTSYIVHITADFSPWVWHLLKWLGYFGVVAVMGEFGFVATTTMLTALRNSKRRTPMSDGLANETKPADRFN